MINLIKKFVKLVLLFAFGIVLVLVAKEAGINVDRIKNSLDRELVEAKAFINRVAVSAGDVDYIGGILNPVLVVAADYFEWIVLVFICFVVIRMIIFYMK